MKKSKGSAPSDVIKTMRAKAKLSQDELARALGIGQSVLSKFEKGRTKVPLTALLAIADACGFEIQAVSTAGDQIPLQPQANYERVGIRARKNPPSKTTATAKRASRSGTKSQHHKNMVAIATTV